MSDCWCCWWWCQVCSHIEQWTVSDCWCCWWCCQVCSHIVRCYSVAAQFEACRTKIQEISAIVKDVSYVLYYRVRTVLCVLALIQWQVFVLMQLWLSCSHWTATCCWSPSVKILKILCSAFDIICVIFCGFCALFSTLNYEPVITSPPSVSSRCVHVH